jgi:protocatechuate 3,4-dioxygenase beta subunit
VLDADGCTPVSGAEVEIWYCNIEGVYSAEDVQSAAFCTGNDADALAAYFFRGRAIRDAAGKVTFDGCFPGWYPSRSIHIHVLVRPASNAGDTDTSNAIAISQLFFPEAVTRDIFQTVDGYVERGQPDTAFASDNVLTSVDDAGVPTARPRSLERARGRLTLPGAASRRRPSRRERRPMGCQELPHARRLHAGQLLHRWR